MRAEALVALLRHRLLFVLLTVGMTVGDVFAVEWRANSSLNLGLTTSDNINLSEPGTEQSASVAQIAPSVSLVGRGKNSTMFFLSELDYLRSSSNGNDTLIPTMFGSLNSEIVDRTLFIDSSIVVNRVLVGSNGAIDSLNPEGELSTTTRIDVAPRLKFNIDSSTEVQLKYGLNTFFATDDQLLDSTGNSVSADIDYQVPTGGYTLGVSAELQRTDFDLGEPLQQSYIVGKFGKTIGKDLKLDASMGREWNEIPIQTSNTAISPTTVAERSAIWDVAMTWNFSASTSMVAGFGKRTFGERPQLELTHRSRHSEISLNWSRELTRFNVANGAESISDPADDLGIPNQEELVAEGVSVNFQDTRIAIEERIAIAYQLSGRVSILRLESIYSQRDFQFQSERAKSSNLTLRSVLVRQLSKKLSLNMSLEHLRGRSTARYQENRIGAYLKFSVR